MINQNLILFHCDTCELAEHKRVDFPLSKNRTTIPFVLIYTVMFGNPPIFLLHLGLVGLLLMIAFKFHGYFS